MIDLLKKFFAVSTPAPMSPLPNTIPETPTPQPPVEKLPPEKLTGAVERPSRFDRVSWAEGLILQLPVSHEGRNSWLMNYGTSEVGRALREAHNMGWDLQRKCAVFVPAHANGKDDGKAGGK